MTKMKIYDYYNGGFHETYSVDLKGNYYDGKSWSQTDGAHIQSHEHACNICNVDPDNDGLTVKLKDVKQSWCDPKPIYVLEAAPYVKEFPDNLGSTWVIKTNTTGSTVSYGATLSSSIEAAFKQDLSFLVDLAEIEVGTSLSAALTYEGATSTEKSVSCEYREVNSLNTIIVARTPMLIYEYELYGNDGSSAPFAVETSGVPHIANITVEEYNEFAEEYNKSGKGDSALPVIGDEFKLGVPGDPFTYRTSFPKSDTACGKIKDQAGDVNTTNYYGSTATEKYIYESKTSENGVSIELGAERFASVGAFGATVKVTNGISGTTGYSTFYTESIGRGGAAGTQIEDIRYDFNWDVGFWDQDGCSCCRL